MARNLKPAHLKKLIETEAPNGYKFDLANYVYNPSYAYDYPSFQKAIAEDEKSVTYNRIYYFKYHGGNGEYISETFTSPKKSQDGNPWVISSNRKETVLEKADRFSLKKLLSLIPTE